MTGQTTQQPKAPAAAKKAEPKPSTTVEAKGEQSMKRKDLIAKGLDPTVYGYKKK